MRHRDAEFGPEIVDRTGVAAALGVAESDLRAGAPIAVGSSGLPFLYVPLRDREAVDRAVLDVATMRRATGEPLPGVFVFAPEKTGAYSRMFAPHGSLVSEDPATGSASGPLGAYLVQRGLVPARGDVRLVSEQGTALGRQSFVHIRLRVVDGRACDLAIGGAVVPVLEGRLEIP
jgi:trans-2,3-dihydro-3-hydroxyanthranilate isomerase